MQWRWIEIPQDWIWDGESSPIAAEIRAQKGRRQLSWDTVADIVGVKRQALARRLKGDTPWRCSELNRLARAWDMGLTDFTGEIPENRTTVTADP